MKIILPVHHFPPRYNAGAELYTFRLARWLQQHGHDPEVVCVEAIDQSDSGALQVATDTYEGIPVWRLSFDLINAAQRQLWNYDNTLIGEWFAEYLQRVQPDIVHFQAGYLLGIAPLKATVAAGISTALTLHDYWFLCPRVTLLRGDGSLCEQIPDDPSGCAWCMRLANRRYRIPDQLTHGFIGRTAQQFVLGSERSIIADRRMRLLPALSMPDAVIAPSHFLAERFRPYVKGERLHISRYGLDLSQFNQQRRAAPDGVMRIGYIGQIAAHKGVHLAIEAFRQLRTRQQIELHIYGGLTTYPDYVQRLQQLAGNDSRIRFHGRFENSQVADLLKRLDVTVVPSVWYENSPLAIMESHAAGTPVITSKLGGMAELVRHEVDGLHFKPDDAPNLAQQLQRLVDNPTLLRKLQAQVQMPRGIDDEMRQLMDIYQQIGKKQATKLREVA
jgi:glycosyltransferase involved in cell wall biosynthesis